MNLARLVPVSAACAVPAGSERPPVARCGAAGRSGAFQPRPGFPPAARRCAWRWWFPLAESFRESSGETGRRFRFRPPCRPEERAAPVLQDDQARRTAAADPQSPADRESRAESAGSVRPSARPGSSRTWSGFAPAAGFFAASVMSLPLQAPNEAPAGPEPDSIPADAAGAGLRTVHRRASDARITP